VLSVRAGRVDHDIAAEGNTDGIKNTGFDNVRDGVVPGEREAAVYQRGDIENAFADSSSQRIIG
jgi:hypothetical protein